jgi:hypothetical protein
VGVSIAASMADVAVEATVAGVGGGCRVGSALFIREGHRAIRVCYSCWVQPGGTGRTAAVDHGSKVCVKCRV